MTIDFVPEQHTETKPRITVFGVGGAGGNAVNNMINGHLEGVDFVVANTDSQSLIQSLCEHRVQLGVNITHGLGAGARPDIGKVAAEEALDDIQRYLDGNNMVFIAAGMGGGTGTGGAPVIARAAREQGILTVGVITKPFQFEGIQRMRLADLGIQELQQYVDTLIVIPNQNLFRIANDQTTFADAFKMADDVLHAGVRGVTDLMVNPGLINLDFADIRTVMSEMGKAMMGTGEADGEGRATQAAESAINNPLLDNASIEGARGVLINITGGTDLTLHEVDEAASRICAEVDTNANIIFGTSLDHELEGQMRVAVIATGIDADEMRAPVPEPSDKVHVLGFSERKSASDGSGASNGTAGEAESLTEELVLDITDETHKAVNGEGAEGTTVQSKSAGSVKAPESNSPTYGSGDPVAEPVLNVATEQAGKTVGLSAPATVPGALRKPRGEHKTVAASTAGAVAARVVMPDRQRAVDKPTAARLERKEIPSTAKKDNSIDRTVGSANSSPRKPTLFERMTGTGRARREPENEVTLSRDVPAHQPLKANLGSVESGSQAATQSHSVKAQEKPSAGTKDASYAPKISQPLDPRPSVETAPLDKLASAADASGNEEDPLDIPAFLRRQAN